MTNNWIIKQTVDLQVGIDGVKVWPHALLVTGDNLAHTWMVEVTNNHAPVDLLGSVTAYFVRTDGSTVVQNGTIEKNFAIVTLPQACYAYEGDLKSIIRYVNGEEVITLSAVLFHVKSIVTDTIIDPGNVIPSLDELLAQVDKVQKIASEAASVIDDTIKATNDANEAAANASGAATNATTATESANAAAKSANDAADRANAAADGHYLLYDTTGQNTNGPMTQKATTDAINGLKVGIRNYALASKEEKTATSNSASGFTAIARYNLDTDFYDFGATSCLAEFDVNANSKELNIEVSLRNSQTTIATNTPHIFVTAEDTWERVKCRLTKLESVAFDSGMYLLIGIRNSTGTGHVRRAMVSNGNVSVDWVPALED